MTDEGRREEEEDEGAHLVKLKEVISENTSIVTLKHSMTSSFSLHFKDPLTEAKVQLLIMWLGILYFIYSFTERVSKQSIFSAWVF